MSSERRQRAPRPQVNPMPWSDRIKRARSLYPTVDTRDEWEEALHLEGALGALLLNLVRVPEADAPSTGQRGHRPLPTEAETLRRLDEIFHGDFTNAPFDQALRALAGDRSIRHVASKTGLSPSTIHAYLHNRRQPSPADLERIAQGFKKRPSYFLEWRISALCSLLAEYLEQNPEHSVVLATKAGL